MATNIRATAKLESARSVRLNDMPAGRNPAEIFVGMFLVFWAVIPPLVLVILAFGEGSIVHPAAAIFLSVLCLAVALIAARAYFRNDTKTPFTTVRQFYLSALGMRHSHAYDLLVEADKDETPRTAAAKAYDFSSLGGFRDYWVAVRDAGGDTGRVVIDPRHRVEMLAPDLALVTFAFLDQSGARGAEHRKIAVLVDREWHVFNGEWTSTEDNETSWLPAAAA